MKIEFADNMIRDTWLRVTLLANSTTGLLANEVFYFGNIVGDVNVGNTGLPITVVANELDTAAVRRHLSTGINSAAITNIYDLNKDGRVNAIDTSLTIQNRSNRSLRFFTAPVSLRLAISPTSLSTIGASAPQISKASTNFDRISTTNEVKRDATNLVAESLYLPIAEVPLTNISLATSNSASRRTSPTQGLTKVLSTDWIQRVDDFFASHELLP